MTTGTEFERVLPDSGVAAADPAEVRRVIFCSGKVYYDLEKAREESAHPGRVAIVRLEQLSPFPFDLVKQQLDLYPSDADIVWTQEEAKNNGAWAYIEPRFETTAAKAKIIRYVGRPCSASPATGSKTAHTKELQSFLAESFADL